MGSLLSIVSTMAEVCGNSSKRLTLSDALLEQARERGKEYHQNLTGEGSKNWFAIYGYCSVGAEYVQSVNDDTTMVKIFDDLQQPSHIDIVEVYNKQPVLLRMTGDDAYFADTSEDERLIVLTYGELNEIKDQTRVIGLAVTGELEGFIHQKSKTPATVAKVGLTSGDEVTVVLVDDSYVPTFMADFQRLSMCIPGLEDCHRLSQQLRTQMQIAIDRMDALFPIDIVKAVRHRADSCKVEQSFDNGTSVEI